MVEKIKGMFQNTASRNGSYSVGMTALVIAVVIVVNLIAGQLPESVRSIDISDNRIYEISDTSREILADLDQQVTFQVFAEKNNNDDRIKAFLNKYTALSDQIQVEWIDPVLHPAELTENNVSEDTILISCEDTQKSTAVTFDEILVPDEYAYYYGDTSSATEFDGEGQFTSAINYVTSDTQKKIYCTTGHGENTFSTSVTELLEKNNMTEEELNLLMVGEIPEDCDLLFLYSPVTDITEEEKTLIEDYMADGGKVYVMLGDTEDETPNLDSFLEEYGIMRADGYIADMQRNYQGNYYYIFPEITGGEEITEGLASDMVLLVNAHGFQIGDPVRDTVTVQEFMDTSSDAYAVTEATQEQGEFTLGAIATESVTTETDSDTSEDESDEAADSAESDVEEGAEARLTVVTADTLIDPQVTDSFTTLDNLDLFMNSVSANFDDLENVAIEAKSLSVTYNTMQHAGLISLLIIFGIPAVVLIGGFVCWWKRRKA